MPPRTPAEAHRPTRAGAEQSRDRLLGAGLALFAQQGFEKTSTREIAELAQANLAAIRYYFGDKAGLYRAVFFEAQGSPGDDIARFANPALSLEQALQAFYGNFLEPLRHGDRARQCMKLCAREMIEPTGLWEEEIARGIRPQHEALVAVLCRHFGLPQADAPLQRLAVCIAGLGVHMHVGQDVIDAIAPELQAGPDALDRWSQTLVMFALAMVRAEERRRALAEASPASGP